MGYEKDQPSHSKNSRNGYSQKTLRTEDGQLEVDTPRDRKGDFAPQLVKKHQTRFISMDVKIIFLYTKGITTSDIVSTFRKVYGADISASLISRAT